MTFDVHKVIDASTAAGRQITPAALAVAIRAAAMQCIDSETGSISTAKLYELTCELERTKLN